MKETAVAAFEKEATGTSSGSAASEGSELQVEQQWCSMEEAAAFLKEVAGSSSGSVASEGSELQVEQRWSRNVLQVEQ